VKVALITVPALQCHPILIKIRFRKQKICHTILIKIRITKQKKTENTYHAVYTFYEG
jgi:hypothetical protein